MLHDSTSTTHNNSGTEQTLLIDLTKTVSKMEGVLSQVVTQQQAQITLATTAIAEVKLVTDSNAAVLAAHTVEISNVKVDVAGIQSERQGAMSKAMSVISPFIAGIALLLVMAKDIYTVR